MLKRLTVLTLLSPAVVAMPTQHKVDSGQRTQQSQRDSYQASEPAPHNNATNYYQQAAPDKPQGWHKFVAWPEGVTASAIVLTLIAIVWQAWETRKAADAARDSILLQEKAFEQWIEVQNWQWQGVSMKDSQIRVDVEIINNTEYPLIIMEGGFAFGEPIRAKYLLGEDFFLPPKTPYGIEVVINIGADSYNQFLRSGFTLRVAGAIVHKGVLERRQVQQMGGVLTGGISGIHFESILPMHPKETTE